MITYYLPTESTIIEDPMPSDASWRPTPQARDQSEGATTRAEVREGICQWTWRNYPHENIRGDANIYRQHRCGRTMAHRGACRCRYCGRDRASA